MAKRLLGTKALTLSAVGQLARVATRSPSYPELAFLLDRLDGHQTNVSYYFLLQPQDAYGGAYTGFFGSYFILYDAPCTETKSNGKTR